HDALPIWCRTVRITPIHPHSHTPTRSRASYDPRGEDAVTRQLDLFGEEPSPLESARQMDASAAAAETAAEADLTPEQREELLAKVREPALVCTKCRLAESRTNVVFGEGPATAPLMFIGEGP